MKEKLVIKNFGPIKDMELELGRMTVLIGEQATGKSTVAKLLAVCRYFSYIADGFPSSFADGLMDWGLYEFIQKDSYIQYENEHYSITVTNSQNTYSSGDDFRRNFIVEQPVKIKSAGFQHLMDELKTVRGSLSRAYKDGTKGTNMLIPSTFFTDHVSSVIDNPFYLPVERGLQSIFSLGKSSIQNISDSLFNQFARLDQIARSFKDETEIEPLNILYKNVDGKGYIRKKTETEYYSLFNAASGYQSTIPIVLVNKYYAEYRKKSKTFIIEEPELSLFPIAQRDLVYFLVSEMNGNTNTHFPNVQSSLLMATHSPYILTSINNLLYAFQVGEKKPDETSKLIDKKYWLNPEEVSAYLLKSDGTAENIMDEEGLIKAEKIDSVSRELNEDFSKLIDIEMNEASK